MSIENYSVYDEIENATLRLWNRTVTATNIMEDHGEEDAVEYLNQFDEDEQKRMFGMLMLIKKKGMEQVRAEVNRRVANDSE